MSEPISYRLGRKGSLWAALTPAVGLRQTWELSISARGRGGAKIIAPLLESSPQHPLATVTIKGEAYALSINRHELRRGGILVLGGTRKIGSDGAVLDWEMRWLPVRGREGSFQVEVRLRATPRRTGSLRIDLPISLYQPHLCSLPEAFGRGHQALSAYSAYSAHFALLTTEQATAGWDDSGGFYVEFPSSSMGGGKWRSLGLGFGPASTPAEAHVALITRYAEFAGAALHPRPILSPFNPAVVVARLCASDAYAMQGMERLYLKSPQPKEDGSFFAGFPHEPIGALKALQDWNRLHDTPEIPRLLRFGASGICADFQVMGQEGQAEPNKGAFWDKLSGGKGTDFAGNATHGLLSNARLARHLFLLRAAGGEPLLEQSALNICRWLILKQNEAGFYDGARYQATSGLPTDGQAIPQQGALDGAEAIRAFVLAYQATRSEVWIKVAWKVAQYLLDGPLREFEENSPSAAASVILSLLALDAEAPNADLRAAVLDWAAWLKVLPLHSDSPELNYDGFHAGLFECAQTGFAVFGLTRSMSDLRYAFAALSAVPATSRQASWRSIAAHQSALLSLAGLLPHSQIDYDRVCVTLQWRNFTPDPAATPFLSVEPLSEAADAWVEWLPLVCRATDQLLLLVIAPSSVEALAVLKNGKSPLLRDLLTGNLDSASPLHLIPGESWLRVGLFTVDP